MIYKGDSFQDCRVVGETECLGSRLVIRRGIKAAEKGVKKRRKVSKKYEKESFEKNEKSLKKGVDISKSVWYYSQALKRAATPETK